jgi:hypothetical protein
VKAVIPHPHHDPCSLRTRLTKALKLTSSHAASGCEAAGQHPSLVSYFMLLTRIGDAGAGRARSLTSGVRPLYTENALSLDIA